MASSHFILIFTGLEYEIQQTNGECTVSKLGLDDIDSAVEGNYTFMRNSHPLFNFEDLNVQYVGQVSYFYAM